MKKKTKLIYFNSKGLAECTRLLLSFMGVKFEDCRISKKQWSEMKDSVPFGKLPVLEINGMILHQSRAINRYLAKRVGLAGDEYFKSYEIDCAIDRIDELKTILLKNFHYNEGKKKNTIPVGANNEKSQTKPLEWRIDSYSEYDNNKAQELLHSFLAEFDEKVAANEGWFCNRNLTLADFYFFAFQDFVPEIIQFKIDWDKFPSLKQLIVKIQQLPKIKEYLVNRPVSKY